MKFLNFFFCDENLSRTHKWDIFLIEHVFFFFKILINKIFLTPQDVMATAFFLIVSCFHYVSCPHLSHNHYPCFLKEGDIHMDASHFRCLTFHAPPPSMSSIRGITWLVFFFMVSKVSFDICSNKYSVHIYEINHRHYDFWRDMLLRHRL